MNYDEIVEIIGGGKQAAEKIPLFIPRPCVAATINFFEDINNRDILSLNEECIEISGLSVVLTRSVGVDCYVWKCDQSNSVILVPVGLLARGWVLGRLLIRYWERDTNLQYLNSPFDQIDPKKIYLPKKYVPIFGEPDSVEEFWKCIKHLDTTLGDTGSGIEDVKILAPFMIYFSFFHELQHCVGKHAELLAKIGKYQHLSTESFHRAFELQADYCAGMYLVSCLLGKMESDGCNRTQDYFTLFLRINYAILMLLGIVDSARKYIHCYKTGTYSHPIVRHQIIIRGIADFLENWNKSLLNIWAEAEMLSWIKCIHGFSWLTFEVWVEHNKEVPNGMIMQPLQSLMYGGNALASKLQGLIDSELANMKFSLEFTKRFEV